MNSIGPACPRRVERSPRESHSTQRKSVIATAICPGSTPEPGLVTCPPDRIPAVESRFIALVGATAFLCAFFAGDRSITSYSGRPRLRMPSPIVPVLISTKRFCGKVLTGSSAQSEISAGRRAATGRKRTSNVLSAATCSTLYDTGKTTRNL